MCARRSIGAALRSGEFGISISICYGQYFCTMERIVHCVHANQMTVGICSSVIQTVGQGLLISAQKRSVACSIKTPSQHHNSAFLFFLLPLPLVRTEDVEKVQCSADGGFSSSSFVLLLCWLLFNLKCGPRLVMNACYRLSPSPLCPNPAALLSAACQTV